MSYKNDIVLYKIWGVPKSFNREQLLSYFGNVKDVEDILSEAEKARKAIVMIEGNKVMLYK